MSQKPNSPHPAPEYVLGNIAEVETLAGGQGDKGADAHTMSLSLARALSVGCLARLDSAISSVNIWDPTAGWGTAASIGDVDDAEAEGRGPAYTSPGLLLSPRLDDRADVPRP